MVFLPLSGLTTPGATAPPSSGTSQPQLPNASTKNTTRATPHRAGACTGGREATGMTDGATGGTVSHVLADGGAIRRIWVILHL